MMSNATPGSEPQWHSCLYECSVLHERRVPRKHRFEYRIVMMLLDLDELPDLEQSLRSFGHRTARLRPYRFLDSDHLQYPPPAPGAPAIPLRASLTAWLAHQGVTIPDNARIRLLTLPRVLGYVFNPVSFYFIHDEAGQPIAAVAEVQNTFGELKPYLVPIDSTAGATGRFRCVVPKEFYVSPFSGLDLRFDFRLQNPGDRLAIGVNDLDADGATHLVSTLAGTRRPLTDHDLVALTVRHPLVTLRVITLIHWHALRLWLKRLPWYRKADHPEQQRNVLRPHASLARVPPPVS